MSEFAGNMSTLSLNAAIEAGRLGDSAMKFVRAADEVREFSEEYEEFAGKAKESTEELRRTYAGTAEQVEKLTAYLRDNNMLLNRIAESVDKINKQFAESETVSAEEDFGAVLDDLGSLSVLVRESLSHQGKILENMEVIGADYITEAESIRKIETIFEGM